MAKTLIIAEQRNGKLKSGTLEVLSAAASAGHETHVALLGQGIAGLVAELGQYGAKFVHVADNAGLQHYTAEAYTGVLVPLIQSIGAEIILASHSPTGRDLMPHLAAKLDAGYAPDCTSVTLSGTVSVRRPMYAGKATCEVEFIGSGPKLISVRPNALGAPKSTGGTAEVKAVGVSLPPQKSSVAEVVSGNSGRPDVTEAAIVVTGGRSLKNAENFKILEDLADVLGAGVGASRAAVDAGFRPHRDQVGQTGKVVSPNLYIATGVSGAIQHLAGMRTSKVIVAINTDSEAPIFQVADYGVVGDLFTLIPLLTEEAKKLK